MNFHTAILIVLLGVTSNLWLVTAQDFVFPGQTERPSHIPTHQTWGPNGLPNTIPTVRTTTGSSVRGHRTFQECVDDCPVPSEDKPVCGTNSVVYPNLESLRCQQRCGNPINMKKYGQCD